MPIEQKEKVYPPVLTKKDFVRRYQRGEFGNHAPTWDSFEEWVEDDKSLDDMYHIRNRVAGGPTYYNVQGYGLWREWDALCKQVNPSSLYISAMAPTEKTVVQGEVQQPGEKWTSLQVTYSAVPATMREALAKETRHLHGLWANSLVAWYMDPSSYEWLWVLLDRYPEHVIEFSVYSTCWGTIPNRNTVFWEVRKY